MQYKYIASDPQGREISGALEASSERDAARRLRKRDLNLLELSPAVRTFGGKGGGRPKPRDLLLMLHELSILLESGVALIDAMESLAESNHHPALSAAFANMASDLRQGGSFSAALSDSGLNLPVYFAQLAESGELTGQLAQALRQGVEQMEYDLKIQNEMRNALIYPSILVVSGIAAVMLIFILVVPRFAGILKTRADDLPLLSQVILKTGMFFNHYLYWIMAAVACAGFMSWQAFKRPAVRTRLLEWLQNLPLLGEWIKEAETGRWAAMLGTLLENSVPLLRALELAQQSVKVPTLRARLDQVSKAVRGGIPLSQALQDNHALSVTGHNLIRAGERAGELPRMLNSLARLAGDSGRARMKRFLLVLEPVAILLIGGVIGVIITGVILTITSVNQIGL